jgi:hypothetical protein
LEVKGNAHEHIIPERIPDDAGLKFLQFLHRADDVAGTDEAHAIQNPATQVSVRWGKEVGAFTICGWNQLWICIRTRWGNIEQGYELTPHFDPRRNMAEYLLIPCEQKLGSEPIRICTLSTSVRGLAEVTVDDCSRSPTNPNDRLVPDDSMFSAGLRTSLSGLCQNCFRDGTF